MQCTIKKDKQSIDEVLGGYSGQKVDSSRELQHHTGLDPVMKLYIQCLEDDMSHLNEIEEQLAPEDITRFLDLTRQFQDRDNYTLMTGLFVSKLINRSYWAGHTPVVVEMGEVLPLNKMCWSGVEGLHVKVVGNIGELGGFQSNKIYMELDGDAGPCFGGFSRDCEYVVTGDVGSNLGKGSENCVYTLNRITSPWAGAEAIGCTFRTPDKDSVKVLQANAAKGNMIIYITPDGKEETVRDNGDTR